MELSHNSTHRSAMIESFWQAFNVQKRPTTSTNQLLDKIYVDMRHLNSTLQSAPRWIYGISLSCKYSQHSSGGGVQYKKAISITVLEIVILLLTVVFVLFITGHFEHVRWTCQLIRGINEHLNSASAKQKIHIKDRKRLKSLLKLSSLSSSQMKSIEKLIFMKLKISKDNYWSTFSNQQQNISIAFTYISAIQSTTGRNSSHGRAKLKLIRPNVNPKFEYEDDKNIQYVQTTSELPDSSLDAIMEQFPASEASHKIIESVMQEIENKNILYRKNDDNYNITKFYEVMESIDTNQSNNHNSNHNNNQNSSQSLYDEKFADLFEPFNAQEQKSAESSIDLSSFEAQLEMIHNESHKNLILRICKAMEKVPPTTVIKAYYSIKNVYGTTDIEAMGPKIVNYCLGT
eukprot:335720_1